MKRKKVYKPVGNISQVVSKDGVIRYKDQRGIFVKMKSFVSQAVAENESPEIFLTGKARTEYTKEINKPFILKINGKKAPKEIREYLKHIAGEQGITERQLSKNKDIMTVLKEASFDFEVSAKAKVQDGTRGKIKYDKLGRVQFDKSIIFEKINNHNGKIFIGKKEYTKKQALIYFQKQVLKDVAEIREMNDGANPYFVSYEGKLNAAFNILYLPESYENYQIES